MHQLYTLEGNQEKAANPAAHASLSASAGTGKTHVLTSRVLRLLLQGVAPETILCLTFTKAAAAEMENRIMARLASWVRMKDDRLSGDLRALDEPDSPDHREAARRLFARVLDASGGMRIQTIHSFCQRLLAAFPAEAGAPTGIEPLEERAADRLARETLAALASAAEECGDEAFLDDLSTLSSRMGEGGALDYLMRCADHSASLAKLPHDHMIEPELRSIIDLPEGDADAILAERLRTIDEHLFDRLIAANRAAASAKTAAAILERLEAFKHGDVARRIRLLSELADGLLRKDDREPCKPLKGHLAADPDYPLHVERFAQWWKALAAIPHMVTLVQAQAAGLRAGARFAKAYADAKRAIGAADFGDLINWSRRLLAQPEIGAWMRYKLDQRTDHILVDEAQDTNAAQWDIITAMADEYFDGDESFRTLFIVGDFKQAIYGFQGSRPQEFVEQRNRYKGLAQDLQAAWQEAGEGRSPRNFRDLDITRSFRSAQPILDIVNRFIETKGYDALGLDRKPPDHVAAKDLRGRVELWPAFQLGEYDGDEGEEGWMPDRDRLYARHLAEQVARLTEDGTPPGDILILLRSRQLAPLIVARLYEEKVPVAGVDRLLLSEPLAVRDLLATLRFASQPLDELNLACLFVSPLIGWDHDLLHTLAFRRRGSLWDSLRARRDENEEFAEAHRILSRLLSMADFETPARFLEEVLSGSIQGRRKLTARLGDEALDPIDELMLSAIEFERSEGGGIDVFLDWLERGEMIVKREAGEAGDAVRVMTVHGAKGLEAPIVILADATVNPKQLGGPESQLIFPLKDTGPLPLVRPRKPERVAPYDEIMALMEESDLQEHWRLLYVALTRAAERLIVTGTFPARGKELPADCWWNAVERALQAQGAAKIRAPWGGEGLAHEGGSGRRGRKAEIVGPPAVDRPDWLDKPAPQEARPPRPLSPSALDVDENVTYPPPGPAQQEAARRGSLLHSLFERLPGVGPERRREVADRWLEKSAGIADAPIREDLVNAALRVIDDPAFADLFGPEALAEAPIAATLADGRVIAGTVDRLLVRENNVELVDFKTGRLVPESVTQVPRAHLRQMEAYAAALRVIFPEREVSAALLYTSGPRLIALDA
ncbi:MAG: double-strand break repair helicase AddA [Sphingomonas sp.]|nr:double-strand break repair helicase AddA [Sphingomonas sp.]